MSYSRLMSRVECCHDLDYEIQNVDEFQAATGEMFSQGDAVNVFRGNKGTGVCLAKLINGKDVGMIEIRDGARFLSESLQAVFVFGNFSRNDLERNRSAKFGSILR